MNAKQELIKRINEYVEYAANVKRFSDVAFYEDVKQYIETTERKLAEANEENDGLKDVISDFELDEINHKGCVKELKRKLAMQTKVVEAAKECIEWSMPSHELGLVLPEYKKPYTKYNKALSDYEASKEYTSQEVNDAK